MDKVDIKELNGAIDAFKNTVGVLSEISAISKEAQKVSENIRKTSLEVSQNLTKISAKADTISKATVSVIKGSKEAADKVTAELDDLNRKIGAYLDSNSEQMKSVSASLISETEKIIFSNESLGKKLQDYTLSTQKSVDELRIQDATNAREIREKIADMNSSVFYKLDVFEKRIQELSNEVAQVRLQHIKCHKLVTACLVTSVVTAVAVIVGMFI